MLLRSRAPAHPARPAVTRTVQYLRELLHDCVGAWTTRRSTVGWYMLEGLHRSLCKYNYCPDICLDALKGIVEGVNDVGRYRTRHNANTAVLLPQSRSSVEPSRDLNVMLRTVAPDPVPGLCHMFRPAATSHTFQRVQNDTKA